MYENLFRAVLDGDGREDWSAGPAGWRRRRNLDIVRRMIARRSRQCVLKVAKIRAVQVSNWAWVIGFSMSDRSSSIG